MNQVWKVVKRELISLFPVWLFFFVSALIVLIYRSLLLSEYGISITKFYAAAVAAAVVAKVFLIVDHVKIINRYRGRPLVYSIMWKTVIYVIAALLMQYVEALVGDMAKHVTFGAAQAEIFRRMAGPRFWAVQLWVVTLFTIFITCRELVGLIGKEKFVAMFFGVKKHPPHHGAERAA